MTSVSTSSESESCKYTARTSAIWINSHLRSSDPTSLSMSTKFSLKWDKKSSSSSIKLRSNHLRPRGNQSALFTSSRSDWTSVRTSPSMQSWPRRSVSSTTHELKKWRQLSACSTITTACESELRSRSWDQTLLISTIETLLVRKWKTERRCYSSTRLCWPQTSTLRTPITTWRMQSCMCLNKLLPTCKSRCAKNHSMSSLYRSSKLQHAKREPTSSTISSLVTKEQRTFRELEVTTL